MSRTTLIELAKHSWWEHCASLLTEKHESSTSSFVADHQGPHCVGIQGKWRHKVPVRENTGNFAKSQKKHNFLFVPTCELPDSEDILGIAISGFPWSLENENGHGKVMEHEKLAKSHGIMPPNCTKFVFFLVPNKKLSRDLENPHFLTFSAKPSQIQN